MSQRTTITAVQTLLGTDPSGDYDAENSPSLQPFVDTATVIVDRVATCANTRGYALSDGEAELIERWLAAHYYVQRDQTYASGSQGGASGSFQGQTGMYLESSKYGQSAIRLDWSGCLGALNKGTQNAASMFWGGKMASEALDYDDRN